MFEAVPNCAGLVAKSTGRESTAPSCYLELKVCVMVMINLLRCSGGSMGGHWPAGCDPATLPLSLLPGSLKIGKVWGGA